jgi:hypothetical protein
VSFALLKLPSDHSVIDAERINSSFQRPTSQQENKKIQLILPARSLAFSAYSIYMNKIDQGRHVSSMQEVFAEPAFASFD